MKILPKAQLNGENSTASLPKEDFPSRPGSGAPVACVTLVASDLPCGLPASKACDGCCKGRRN